MKMREYVDSIQGEGSWDRMHDAINGMNLFGWEMPPVVVDGKTISIFPGTNREVTLEEVQNEIRKSLKRVASGKVKDQPPDSGREPVNVIEWLKKLDN